ncbi:MAG: mtgA [Fibrobacteria bacterium]|jgi:monofunctional biosynthetic peptidoglycan transglycosylase|nr:mtgA [Fibrobacteria bacterium]
MSHPKNVKNENKSGKAVWRGGLRVLNVLAKAVWAVYQIALGLLLLAVLWGALQVWQYFHIGDIRALRARAPETTAFIEAERASLERAGLPGAIRWTWIPLDSIPRPIKELTLVAEDSKFYSHQGFDLEQIEYALVANHQAGRKTRGASTITQQVAKNLYLGGEKEMTRKAREAALALLLEHYLEKDRILEIYLNIAQFAPGVFGVREGARHHFGRDVRALTQEQMLGLVALLPAPEKWNPRRPTGAYLAHKRRVARNYGLFRGIQLMAESDSAGTGAYDSLGSLLSEENWRTLRSGPQRVDEAADTLIPEGEIPPEEAPAGGPSGEGILPE